LESKRQWEAAWCTDGHRPSNPPSKGSAATEFEPPTPAQVKRSDKRVRDEYTALAKAEQLPAPPEEDSKLQAAILHRLQTVPHIEAAEEPSWWRKLTRRRPPKGASAGDAGGTDVTRGMTQLKRNQQGRRIELTRVYLCTPRVISCLLWPGLGLDGAQRWNRRA
jgi:hypothetical protein